MMDEESALGWVASNFGLLAVSKMQIIVDAVIEESLNQNLIARSTLQSIWLRHIVDSAQLLALNNRVTSDDLWVDIGSGAGFPGLVVAALSSGNFVLVEPRKRRAAFLSDVVDRLGIRARTHISCDKIEHVKVSATVISARAVGQISDIFTWASNCFTKKTRWVLPRGRIGRDEVASVARSWHGTFHVEHSITDPDSMIVLASGVSRR